MGRMGVSEFYFGSPSFFCALPNASHRIFTLFGAHFPHASPPLSSQNVQVLNPLLSCLFVMHIIWYLMFWRLLYRCSTNRKPTLRSSCICVYIYIHICMYIYVYMCIYGTPPVPPPPMCPPHFFLSGACSGRKWGPASVEMRSDSWRRNKKNTHHPFPPDADPTFPMHHRLLTQPESAHEAGAEEYEGDSENEKDD